MREKLKTDALDWIKARILKPAGLQLVRARSHRAGGKPSREWDWIIDARAKDSPTTVRLLVEVKARVTPQTALAILTRMQVAAGCGAPLLCCPVVSPRLQELCDEYRINFLDAAGNCRLAAPGLYIERREVGKVRREKPSVDPFACKASRMARAMLSEPARGWQVQQLARWENQGMSLGLASRVKQGLLEQGYAVARERLIYVRNPQDLLRAWTQNYRPQAEAIPLYVTGEPPAAEAAIAEWCRANNIQYALTQLSGAWRAAAAVRYQRSTIYVHGVEDEAWAGLSDFGNAKRVESGANVVLWRTYDPAVFIGARALGDPPLSTVSALQLHLDLMQLHGRGEEAARSVYDAELAAKFAEAASSQE